MKKTQQFLVSGRVQGVSFRYFTQQCAHKLGLVGFARNLADGCVEVIAQGDAESLMSLKAYLQRGPEHAEVKDVIVTAVEEPEIMSEFLIAADGVKPWQKK